MGDPHWGLLPPSPDLSPEEGFRAHVDSIGDDVTQVPAVRTIICICSHGTLGGPSGVLQNSDSRAPPSDHVALIRVELATFLQLATLLSFSLELSFMSGAKRVLMGTS